MSDVIRNAVVKLAIQLQNPDLKLGDLKPAVQQQKELAAATKQAADSTKAAQAAVDKSQAAFDRWQAKVKAAHQAQRDIAREQRTQTKVLADLDSMVKMEAESVSLSGTAAMRAAQQNQALSAASLQLADSYRRVAANALGMAKGFAFIVAGQSDALSKALPYLFVLEGTITLVKNFTGVTKAIAAAQAAHAATMAASTAATGALTVAIQGLYVALGPVGWALAAVAAAGALVYAIYRNLTADSKELAEEQFQLNRQQDEQNEILAMAKERCDTLVDARLKTIDTITDLTEKEKRLRQEVSGPDSSGYAEHRLRAAEALLDVEKQQADEAKKKIKDQIELVKQKEKELLAAKEALKAEEDKSRALRASIGALNAGEQRKLDRLVTKAEGGGTLSRQEAIDISKLGGDAGQKIAEHFLQSLDRGLGERASKLSANLTGEDPRAKAQAKFEQAQVERNKATGGVSAEEKIRALEAANDELVKTSQQGIEDLLELQRALIKEVAEYRNELSLQKQAQQAQRSASR